MLNISVIYKETLKNESRITLAINGVVRMKFPIDIDPETEKKIYDMFVKIAEMCQPIDSSLRGHLKMKNSGSIRLQTNCRNLYKTFHFLDYELQG